MNQHGGGHPDIGPELRRLAQALLDRLDPALRAAGDAGRPPGRCQQVWCPVCALGALITGEQHPLLAVIAEHSVALVTVIRAMTAEPGQEGAGSHPPAAGDDDGAPAGNGQPCGQEHSPPDGRYQRIPIVVQPASD